jgi:hypothetical protein
MQNKLGELSENREREESYRVTVPDCPGPRFP